MDRSTFSQSFEFPSEADWTCNCWLWNIPVAINLISPTKLKWILISCYVITILFSSWLVLLNCLLMCCTHSMFMQNSCAVLLCDKFMRKSHLLQMWNFGDKIAQTSVQIANLYCKLCWILIFTAWTVTLSTCAVCSYFFRMRSRGWRITVCNYAVLRLHFGSALKHMFSNFQLKLCR